MASFYSSWVGGDDWRLRLDVSESTSNTQAVYSCNLYIENVRATWRNGSMPWSIIIGGTEVDGTKSPAGVTTNSTVLLGSATITKTKTHAQQTLSVAYGSYMSGASISSYAKGVNGYGSIALAAKPSYSVAYSANGGSGAPASQSKWYGESLTLSGSKPSWTGYTFLSWNTAQGGGGTSYQPGATYTSNAALNLYAQWQEQTYTVTFDANGGTDAPEAQTKYYTQPLTLPTETPTRDLYDFLGWSTSAGGVVVYKAGDSLTVNADTTLYAVWQLAWQAPVIKDVDVYRCDASGNAGDDGTYAKVSFTWSTFSDLYPSTSVSAKVGTKTLTGKTGTTSGSYAQVFDGLDTETTYEVLIEVKDSQGSSTWSTLVPSMAFHLDFSPDFGIGLGGIAVKDKATTVYNGLYDEHGTAYLKAGEGLTIDDVYPVGSIYMSYVSTSPAQLFGGTWAQLTGVFPRFANDTATGGADSTSYSFDHNHYMSLERPSGATWNFVSNRSGIGYHDGDAAILSKALLTSTSALTTLQNVYGPASAYGGTSGKPLGSKTINAMPAYQDVYAWRRTA